jgi:hypothetical protein
MIRRQRFVGGDPTNTASYAYRQRKEQVMRDEMDSRMWNEHHEDFSASIADAIDKLHAVFKQIHRHNFCAPWDEPCDSQR